MTTNVDDVVRRYLAAFNETDAGARREALRAVFAADGGYTDPHVDLKGVEQIDGFIAAVQSKYPGVVFSLAGAVDAHHDQARFTWHAGPPAGAPLALGFDVAVFERGRIRQVYGFVDQAPPG